METREQTIARGEAELEQRVVCVGCEDVRTRSNLNGWCFATWVDGEPVWLCPACLSDDVDQVF